MLILLSPIFLFNISKTSNTFKWRNICLFFLGRCRNWSISLQCIYCYCLINPLKCPNMECLSTHIPYLRFSTYLSSTWIPERICHFNQNRTSHNIWSLLCPAFFICRKYYCLLFTFIFSILFNKSVGLKNIYSK